MTALKAAIQKEMYSALEETTEDSYQDLKKNVGFFYSAPEGSRYKRTNQLRDSPQLDTVNYSGDVAEGQISINTGTQYDPSGHRTILRKILIEILEKDLIEHKRRKNILYG